MPNKSIKPDWLPDWRDESAYDFPSSNNLRLWAWEFLRRNPKYQKAWKDNYEEGDLSLVVNLGVNSGSCPGEVRTRIYDEMRNQLKGWTVETERREFSSYAEWHKEALPGETLKYLGKTLASEFGLNQGDMIDPSLSKVNRQKLRFFGAMSPPYISGPAAPERSHFKELAPFEVLARFDVRSPLDAQWERLKPFLLGHMTYIEKDGYEERGNGRNHVDKFPSYVRLLDGQSSGATYPEMAETLFPEKCHLNGSDSAYNTVKNRLKTAKSFRDERYLYLSLK